MKKVLLLLIAVIGLNSSTKAQSGLELINLRKCDVEFRLYGNCPGSGPCDFTIVIPVPAGSPPMSFADVDFAILASTTPSATTGCLASTFVWHKAEIQNVHCCTGGGMTVGDGVCGSSPGPNCFGGASDCQPPTAFCGIWAPINIPPGVRVTAY